jgi:DNA-binding transcriptional LysR family regulator
MLKNVNLNLLTVLQALLKTGSVSETASLINRTPSAVSSSLAQLRDLLQDPLFVRVGSRLQPTARALQLREPVDQALRHIEGIFEEPNFDPTKSDREFVVALSDVLLLEVGPKLIPHIRKIAPRVSIQFCEIEGTISDSLTSRELDFAIIAEASQDSLPPAPLSYSSLWSIKVQSVLMSSGHPLANRGEVTLTDLNDYPNLVFRPNDVLTKRVKHPSFELPAAVTASSILVVPTLLEDTDLCAIIPSCVADREKNNTKLSNVTLTPEIEIPFGLVWSSLVQHDEAHSWFREQLMDIAYQYK